jgi:hypothetical protein
MDIANILKKWDETKKKIDYLEEKLKKYKSNITKQMNKQEVDKLTSGGYTVTRRRTTRTTLSKENVPADIWKEYSTRCSYDAFFLIKN